jgi:hypothetical protein
MRNGGDKRLGLAAYFLHREQGVSHGLSQCHRRSRGLMDFRGDLVFRAEEALD